MISVVINVSKITRKLDIWAVNGFWIGLWRPTLGTTTVSVLETRNELDGIWPDSELPNEKYLSFSQQNFFLQLAHVFFVNPVLLGVSIINTYYVPFLLKCPVPL